MLPTSVESGFEEPLWAGIPEINGPDQPIAELLLKPYTYGDIAEIQERFGICRRCDGQHEVLEVVPPSKVGEPPVMSVEYLTSAVSMRASKRVPLPTVRAFFRGRPVGH